ncbi:MAG: hypothetical protein LUO91_07285 [Methanomicrobiales archaeon]|nr:hypothetical protein [Methanomicrobiales archaeon]
MFAIQSGIPVIAMGVLLIVMGLVGFLFPRSFPADAVVTLLFSGFGIFLIWLGLTK